MASKRVDDTVAAMQRGGEVTFPDLASVCRQYFGEPRIKGSHHIYKTPWAGDPRINIQNDKGKAKTYQARQVLAALDKLRETILAQRKVDEHVKAGVGKPKKK